MMNGQPPIPMNESESEAGLLETTPPPVPFKDRYTGLVIFGILTLLLGGLIGLFIPLAFFGMAASAKTTGTPVNTNALLPILGIYGALAVVLIWLGIGSILARRWARALLLIWSWAWLVFGIIGGVAMICVLPGVFRNMPATGGPGQPAIAMGPIIIIMFLVFAVMFVALPAVWLLFYRSPHVKATCEARNPGDCWTDACPLPVLGFCLWLLFSVPMFLAMPMMGHGVAPFFGTFLTGVTGTLFYLLIAWVWAWSAWNLYHLESRGWWVILVGLVLFTLSSLLTYAFHGPVEMYQLMGYPDAQIAQMQSLLAGNRMEWFTVISMLPLFLYLFWIKPYLKRPA